MTLTKELFSLAPLTCPIDHLPLRFFDKHVGCDNGHCYDVAKQGYINLLGSAEKRSKNPGDSKLMVLARANLLASGFYQPIVNTLVDIVSKLSLDEKKSDALCVLDAGCGEGYYLKHCKKALEGAINAIGVDISKEAITQATKSKDAITWLVASNRRLPIASASVDIIVCAFGFPDYAEFRRILKPDGHLIMVDPAAQHLLELRKIIYPYIKPYVVNEFALAKVHGFSCKEQVNCCYSKTANTQTLDDILQMSPHLYRASAEGKARIKQQQWLDLTMDVNFTILS